MSTTPAPIVSKASSPKQADLGTTPEPGRYDALCYAFIRMIRRAN